MVFVLVLFFFAHLVTFRRKMRSDKGNLASGIKLSTVFFNLFFSQNPERKSSFVLLSVALSRPLSPCHGGNGLFCGVSP
jgi:hypothetical protein